MTTEDFRIGILGAGTVGLTLAAFFEQCNTNYTILVKKAPVRPVHYQAGGQSGTIKADRFISVDELNQQPFDLIISTVKRYDIPATVIPCSRMLQPGGFILSVQNGIHVQEQYGHLGDRTLHAPVFIVSETDDNGINVYRRPEIILPADEQYTKIRTALAHADIAVSGTLDISENLWKKMIFVSGISGVCSLFDLDVGGIRSDAGYYEMFQTAITESVSIAVKEGMPFSKDVADTAFKAFEKLPDPYRPSMAYDFLHHRKTEVAWLSGTISNLGKKWSVPVPVHDTISGQLQQREQEHALTNNSKTG